MVAHWRNLLLGTLLSLLGAKPTLAQLPVGDGLDAFYYDGSNFERPMLHRRDPQIDFNWQHGPPGPGLPAEFFSVRWSGWLVPPVSGRYVLHITIDDGMRVWLNDKLVLNEWRGQPVSNFAAAVQLQAGQAYKLRVDYFQSVLDTRARFTWERPDAKPAPESWRNAWGLAQGAPAPEVISSRYLFTRKPVLPAPVARPAVASVLPSTTAAPKPAPLPVAAPAPLPLPRQRPATVPSSGGPMPRAIRPTPTPPPPPDDSLNSQRVAQLSAGQEVTLPELLFDQGQATLQPAAQAALDDLATALQAQPSLHLEVQGHTDNQGNAELNRQLSQHRAETVCQYLVARGVSTERLLPVGYGGTRPIADNSDPSQRPRNRRVVLVKL